MRFTLDNFKRFVSPRILQRGMEYFVNDAVREVQQIEPGQYEAEVDGTEVYVVNIALNGPVMVEIDCSCPYNAGPMCKHIVAVALCLKEIRDEDADWGENSNNLKKYEPTVAEQVDALLNAVEDAELREYVKQLALKDRDFRSGLTLAFAHLLEGESRELYAGQVKAILNKAKGKDGFIGWRSMRNVYDEVSRILDDAMQRVQQREYQVAIQICCAVMEEMVEAMQFADDSSGDMGACIEDAVDILSGLAKEGLPRADRSILLRYCIDAFKSGVYKGWDWHLGVMEIAVDLVESEGEVQEVLELLKSFRTDKYERSQAQMLILRVLEKGGDQAQAVKFMSKNIANPDVRKLTIDRAIEANDLDMAERLARDGIKHDATDSPGYLDYWYERLLKIAMHRKDNAGIIEVARYLYLHAYDNSDKYYDILKKHVDPSNWSDFVDGLVTDIQKADRWRSAYRIADIYVQEEWWPRLMEHVEQNAYFAFIVHYEKYLLGTYAGEVAMLYRQCVVLYLENNVSRSHYQTACHYIGHIRDIGEAAMAQDLIEFLRRLYPRRPALLEELSYI